MLLNDTELLMTQPEILDTPISENAGKTYIDPETTQIFIADLMRQSDDAEEQSPALVQEVAD